MSSMDGIIECIIIEGSFNSESFLRFVKGLLNKMNPYPSPNSVLVMDNCRIHKNALVAEAVAER